jgi:hypothetical protein
MAELPLGGLKRKVLKKQLKHPLPKWHSFQGSMKDCGPYAVATVANALYDTKVVDPKSLARDLEGPPAVRGMLLPARFAGWATMPWGVVGALRQLGLHARWRVMASTERLLRNLDENRATIVVIGEPLDFRKGKYAGWSHYLSLYGWDPEEGWSFVDSSAPKRRVFSSWADAEFRDLWTRMGRQVIEVWGGLQRTWA